MALDVNIVNNLFTQGGAVGAGLASSAVINTLDKQLFSKLGNNNLLSIGGFLGSQTALAIKNLLFTSAGIKSSYDPVWKLTTFTYSDGNTSAGDLTQATPDDFAGADHPKYKFNFTVSFEFRATMLSKIQAISNLPIDASASEGSDQMSAMAFGLKTASRPNPTVVYQDINMYNYRTKIATKMEYGTVTLTFYDDVNNRAHNIFAAYLQSISPIANVSNEYSSDVFDQMGITPEDFANPVGQTKTNTSSLDVSDLGALNQYEKQGLIRTLTLSQHLPLKYTGTGSNYTAQKKSIQYVFYNPKIINMNLDDLDMSASEVSMVALTFTYDAVYIQNITGAPTSTLVGTAPANQSLFTKFLSSIDNSINPAFSSVNNAEKALNSSTIAQQVKSVTAAL